MSIDYLCTLCDRVLAHKPRSPETACCRHCQQRRSRYTVKANLVEYKGGSCQLCGYEKCLSALEFHHVDPTEKEKDLGDLIKYGTRTQAEVEVRKCAVLCANCHREVHAALEFCEWSETRHPLLDRLDEVHVKQTAKQVAKFPPLKPDEWKRHHPKYNGPFRREDYHYLPPDFKD